MHPQRSKSNVASLIKKLEVEKLKNLRHTQSLKKWSNGLVVQLVRISACHAGGRGFESRPDRNKKLTVRGLFLVYRSN